MPCRSQWLNRTEITSLTNHLRYRFNVPLAVLKAGQHFSFSKSHTYDIKNTTCI